MRPQSSTFNQEHWVIGLGMREDWTHLYGAYPHCATRDVTDTLAAALAFDLPAEDRTRLADDLNLLVAA